MKKICVITGAAGGIGFGAAKKMGETHSLLISDVNQAKLDKAVKALREEGIEVEGMLVDVGERDQVEALAEKAKRLGQVAAVIHLAGLTPTFAPPELIMKVNALGPMYINEAF